MFDQLENPIVLGVDVGTTNVKCVAYDKHIKTLGKASDKIALAITEDEKHEINPNVLWDTFKHVVKECLLDSNLNAEDISCIGISTQRGSFLTWNRNTSETYHNIITWKDRRADKWCDRWNTSFFLKVLKFLAFVIYFFSRKITFQILSKFKFKSAMVLTRLHWILKNDSQIHDQILHGDSLFGTIDTWLVWKLTGGKVHATDGSNACVTGFFNPIEMAWDNCVLNVFGIPSKILPTVKSTSDFFGETEPHIFGTSIPIFAVVGDQQASMFGAKCFQKGNINCTMGTGTFLNINTGSSIAYATSDVYPLVAWTLASNTTYMIECGIHDVGTLLSIPQNLGFFSSPEDSNKLAQSVLDNGGVYFIPGDYLLEGKKKKNSHSSLVGLNARTTCAHIVRAILESMAFQVYLLFEHFKSYYEIKETTVLRVCGGISKNDFVVQLISNLTQLTAKRSKEIEFSSLGAAFFAGLRCGIWRDLDEIISIEIDCDIFEPMNINVQKMYYNWKEAVS